MIFNAYYREHRRTSLFDVAWIEAESKAEAIKLVTPMVKAKFPQGEVTLVFRADNSPNLIPVKNADGKSCIPSEVY